MQHELRCVALLYAEALDLRNVLARLQRRRFAAMQEYVFF